MEILGFILGFSFIVAAFLLFEFKDENKEVIREIKKYKVGKAIYSLVLNNGETHEYCIYGDSIEINGVRVGGSSLESRINYLGFYVDFLETEQGVSIPNHSIFKIIQISKNSSYTEEVL